MAKKGVLSEAYYKKMRIMYLVCSIAYLIMAIVVVSISLIIQDFSLSAFIMACIAISVIYQTRLDSLKENYTLYTKG